MGDDVPVLLCDELHLYLRHVAKITIAVMLPEIKGSSVSISNWEVMEKLKSLAAPEVFLLLRVGKTTRQILYFEGELSSLRALRKAIVQLHGKAIKLNGLTQQLKVRAGEADLKFPAKKDWEGYFHDRGVPSFDEGLPGDRCDTVCVQGIPTGWMVPTGSQLPVVTSTSKVHDKIERHDFLADMLSKSFGKFGNVKRVDILENATDLASGNFSSFGPSTPQSTFDGYVQYEDYESFSSAMASLRGMKLVRRIKGQTEMAVMIIVNFDKSSHMSDRNVRKRRKDIEKMLDLEIQEQEKARAAAEAEKRREQERRQQEKKQREEEERRKREKAAAEAERIRQEKERKRREQEERQRAERRKRHAEKEALRRQRQAEKQAEQERQVLHAQRCQDSERLLKQVLLMAAAQREIDLQRERDEEERQERRRREEERKQKKAAEEAARRQEAELVIKQRDTLVEQVKSMEDRRLELQRTLLKRKLASERALLQASKAT